MVESLSAGIAKHTYRLFLMVFKNRIFPVTLGLGREVYLGIYLIGSENRNLPNWESEQFFLFECTCILVVY